MPSDFISKYKKHITNQQDINKQLMEYARDGYLHLVRFAIENGAEVSANRNIALRLSAENGHLKVVQYLVEHGADVHAENCEALRWASRNGHFEIVRYLVGKGANIHAENNEALRMSIMNGYLPSVSCLDTNVHTLQGRPSTYNYWEIVHFLIDKGADIKVLTNEQKRRLYCSLLLF